MADSDFALAMAVAENSDSSQDEDFQLPITHVGQLCILNKFSQHPQKRQKKDQCLSKKRTSVQKPQRVTMEGKENYYQRNHRDASESSKCKFADPDLSQVRRPLAARKPDFRKGALPSSATIARAKEWDKKGETAPEKDKKHINRSPKVFLDQPSETHFIAVGEAAFLPSNLSASPDDSHEANKALIALNSLVQDNAHPISRLLSTHIDIIQNPDGGNAHLPTLNIARKGSKIEPVIDPTRIAMEEVILRTLEGSQTSPKEDATKETFKPHTLQQAMREMAQQSSPIPSFSEAQGSLHHQSSKDGDLLEETMEGNATFSFMDEVVSLAEEEDLTVNDIEQKQRLFEPDRVQQGKVPADKCLSTQNVNTDSQFNALVKLCIDSVSADDEGEPLVGSLSNSLAAEDGPLMVEELISSLMTQDRCRESLISGDVHLEHVEVQSTTEVLSMGDTKNLMKTWPEAQELFIEVEDCSDHEQVDLEGRSFNEEIQECSEPKHTVECPVCGSCITGLSLEQREVHTNACLDSIDQKETHTNAELSILDTDQAKLDGKSELGECVQEDCLLNLTRVLRWLETLNLSRYANVFVREEVDWETLQCLTDEDLSTLGITALGPRRKILYAIQQLEKGRHKDSTNTMNQAAQEKQHGEVDTSGRKLITDFYEMPSSLRGKNASGLQTGVADKEKAGGCRGLAVRKRILRELGGIPEWMSIPGTKFRVDAFQHLRADCSHWFLTHFHTDHYQGLTRAFRYGHVYCSPITAQLVNARIGVPWERLKSLPLDQTTEIEGVKVTLIDANHCPGSVMILFEPQNGKAVLHTGDFRFCEDMASSPVLQACNIHTLVLDTTYCNPQYDFPKQEVVVQFIVDAIQAEAFNPNTLFLIGTYTIGKERIFFEVAKALQKKIYCSATKLQLLQCMNFPEEDMRWLTTNDQDAHIHVVPLWSIASFKRMSYIARHSHGRYNSIISFSPTGWSFGRGKKRTPGRRWRQGTIVRYEVPYSEHCSFKELREFVKFINPVNVIPSVHNDSAEAADALVALLLNEEEDD